MAESLDPDFFKRPVTGPCPGCDGKIRVEPEMKDGRLFTRCFHEPMPECEKFRTADLNELFFAMAAKALKSKSH